MSQTGGWRRNLARWLDPELAVVAQPAPGEETPGSRHERTPDPWPAISEQFALRILAAAYQIGSHLEAAEADERDPDRLEKLYRIDHANARVRRQAENLQVLAGRKVEDAGSQVTPLLDVIRASASTIESYPRVQIGRIAELAIVEFAADDVIRVLTELLDNATRFSPPTSSVIVSAHITERGSVLLRIEDAGVGIQPAQLPALNAMLAGEAPPMLHPDAGLQLGLIVVQRLALTHRMRVHLSSRHPGGTTATVLIPEWLLCEIAHESSGTTALTATANGSSAPVPSQRAPDVVYRGSVAVPPMPSMPDDPRPVPVGGAHALVPDPVGGAAPAEPEPIGGADAAGPPPALAGPPPALPGPAGGLPRRVPASLRGDAPPAPAAAAFPEQSPDRQQWPDETADFAAGITDAQWRATEPSFEGHPR